MVRAVRRLLLVWGAVLVVYCIVWLSFYPHELQLASMTGDEDSGFILRQLIPHQVWDIGLGFAFVGLSIAAKKRPRASFLFAVLILIAPAILALVQLHDRVFLPVVEFPYGMTDASLNPLTRLFVVLIPWEKGGGTISVTLQYMRTIINFAAVSMWCVPLISTIMFFICAAALIRSHEEAPAKADVRSQSSAA
jgi:hypothetical protein